MGLIPVALLDSLEDKYGFNRSLFVDVHEKGELVTSVRFNPNKKTDDSFLAFNTSSQVPWSTEGFYLEKRPSFTLDPLFHSGAYYVQEASSMFLEQVLRHTVDLKQPQKVLDCCAAPGGKSTLIQSLISNESLLVCNEVIKSRVAVLSENITKWGALNTIVTNNDPSDFSGISDYFDVIVTDAPCSGSGLFRKDPDAVKEWSPENVDHCSLRQKRILADIIPVLKDNGILIYSTCSYSAKENEDLLDWIMEAYEMETIKVPIQNFTGIIETQSATKQAYGYRFYPDRLKGEGFFIAALRKKFVSETRTEKDKKRPALDILRNPQSISAWTSTQNGLEFFLQNEYVVAFPQNHISDLELLRNKLYIKKAGINLGGLVRGDLIPSHAMALSSLMNQEFQHVDLDLENARQYLRHQSFSVNTNFKGWALVKYGGIALGLIKILPGRINNYYPREWRILNK
jgi:NOL1/NOP2/sun family putative RNA methylase